MYLPTAIGGFGHLDVHIAYLCKDDARIQLTSPDRCVMFLRQLVCFLTFPMTYRELLRFLFLALGYFTTPVSSAHVSHEVTLMVYVVFVG